MDEIDELCRNRINELKKDRRRTIDRGRDRGQALQHYLLWMNGGALVATFSLAGVFVKEAQPLDFFAYPAIAFIISIGLALVAIYRSVRLQHRRKDVIEKILDQLEDGECTDEMLKVTKAKLKCHEQKGREHVQRNDWLVIFSFGALIIGFLIGVVYLFISEPTKKADCVRLCARPAAQYVQPATPVTLTFDGYTSAEAADALKLFDRMFQKGGG